MFSQAIDFILSFQKLFKVDVSFMQKGFIFCISLNLVIGLINHIFLAIGLSKMAKNRKFKHRYLAWIPLANVYYLGRLAGDVSVFNLKIKNVGLWAMLAVFICEFCSWYIDFCLYFNYSYNLIVNGIIVELPQTMPSIACNVMYIVASVVDIVEIILLFAIYISLFNRYCPKHGFIFALIAFFFEGIAGILIFCIRNKKYLSDAEILAARYAYVNRNARGGNSFGSQNYGEQPTEKQEDPFTEFSNKKEEPFEEF